VVKVHLTECLTLSCHSQIRLETVSVQYGDKRLYRVEGGTRLRNILRDVTTSSCQDSIDRSNAVRRGLHLDVVDGFK
jgi:hypothetical protein